MLSSSSRSRTSSSGQIGKPTVSNRTGSGSVITEDVEPDALALARGRQVQKAGWAERFREAKRKRKAGQ